MAEQKANKGLICPMVPRPTVQWLKTLCQTVQWLENAVFVKFYMRFLSDKTGLENLAIGQSQNFLTPACFSCKLFTPVSPSLNIFGTITVYGQSSRLHLSNFLLFRVPIFHISSQTCASPWNTGHVCLKFSHNKYKKRAGHCMIIHPWSELDW